MKIKILRKKILPKMSFVGNIMMNQFEILSFKNKNNKTKYKKHKWYYNLS